VSSDVLIVFLKRPRIGEVKTRLIPALGEAAAAHLYRILAEEEIRRTAPSAGEYRRLFFFAPEDAGADMRAWFPGETWMPQRGADLGARMAGAFEQAFAEGARRSAIIGTDVPWVSRELVSGAFKALDEADVVLGPARDGGYYLLALGEPRPALFQGVAWSTSSVLAQTVEKAGGLGLSVRLLDVLSDIDTLDDVRREWQRLRPLVARYPSLVQALEPLVAR
jgi:rSAM/selenodomain-associated transferase 1